MQTIIIMTARQKIDKQTITFITNDIAIKLREYSRFNLLLPSKLCNTQNKRDDLIKTILDELQLIFPNKFRFGMRIESSNECCCFGRCAGYYLSVNLLEYNDISPITKQQ